MRIKNTALNALMRVSDTNPVPVRFATPVVEFLRSAPRNTNNLQLSNAYGDTERFGTVSGTDTATPLIVYAPLPPGAHALTILLALEYAVKTSSSTPRLHYAVMLHPYKTMFEFSEPTLRYYDWSEKGAPSWRPPYDPQTPSTYGKARPRLNDGGTQRYWHETVRSSSSPPYAYGYNPFGSINSSGSVSENVGYIELNFRTVSSQNFVRPGTYVIDLPVPIVGFGGVELRVVGEGLTDLDATLPSGLIASTAQRVGIYGAIYASTRPI